MQQTQQQRRAAYALKKMSAQREKIDAAHPGNSKKQKDDREAAHKEFASLVAGFPAMIQMNGLGQAAAFFRSRNDADYDTLYQLLSDWLCAEEQIYPGSQDLLAALTSQDMHHYRFAQAEALLLLDWVKRFAKANCGA